MAARKMAAKMAPKMAAEVPDSVLLRVLALLPLRDRLRAARVCRRWRQLVQDRVLWADVDLSPHKLSSKILWQLVRHRLGDSLRTLRVRGALLAGGRERLLTPALLAALAKRCPRLTRLCLAEADLRPLPYESFPDSITVLELSCCEIPAAWFCGSEAQALPRLQHLVVHKVPAFSNQHLLNISSRNRLKTLTLSGTYRVTDAGIQSAAPHLEELQRLVLRHCVVTDSALHFIGRHMKHLRFLEISSAYSLTNMGLACLAALKCLEMLHLDHCDKFSPDAIAALCRALPQLRNLKLDGADFGDEAMGKIQASLPNCSFSHTL
ncbi:F-box/LRR-repeat protein 12 [Cygnus olor]|uniref:F-box/LRR-repeat protein 12 n=1 Tax=Cygnus olor TaxID=8869 RepID=UPI001ADE2CC2|nr:F-box/LRR-repeat protein 12 [Cygnus olor]XP_040398482.1 F-box/LRR-repeat protein 12 [Cygnus olor]